MTQLSISSAYGVSPQSFGLSDNETHPDYVWKTFTEWAQVIDTQIKFQGRDVVVNGERVAITKGAASRYSMVA